MPDNGGLSAQTKVVVIGAGPAGMMAAGSAASFGGNNAKVYLIEKNAKPGRKLAITGKGRCNVTNNADIAGLIENTPGNGRFLYSTYSRFSNSDLLKFFNERGLKLKLERGGRYFPESDRAFDVVDVMYNYVKDAGVKVITNTSVLSLIINEGKTCGVKTDDDAVILCDTAIICTGGCSYPLTGSTGDGYSMAKEAGHSIETIKPALAPLISPDSWIPGLAGLALKNVLLKFYDENNKLLYSEQGEMLFTHKGVSGPVVLSASRHISDYGFKCRLVIDLKPALDFNTLDARLIREMTDRSRRNFSSLLASLLPSSLIPVVADFLNINPEKPCNQITKEERTRLGYALKNIVVNISAPSSIDEAIVTKGGIAVNEINPSTMESKLVKGLYFAGEVLDIDGYTGGYNLTAAFCTGRIAGISSVGLYPIK